MFKSPASCISKNKQKKQTKNLNGLTTVLQFPEILSLLHSRIHKRQTVATALYLTSTKCCSRCEREYQRKTFLCVPFTVKRGKTEEWSKTTYLTLLNWATIYWCSLPLLKSFHGLKKYHQRISEWQKNLCFISQFVCILFCWLWIGIFRNLLHNLGIVRYLKTWFSEQVYRILRCISYPFRNFGDVCLRGLQTHEF